MEDHYQWQPVKRCPQYRYGLISPFVGKLDFEEMDDINDEDYYSADDDRRTPNTHQHVKKFLKQVRESRGYDVDCIPPRRFNSPFRPIYRWLEEDKELHDEVMEAIVFAIGKINAETETHTGKTYKFKAIENAVETIFFLLLTFSAFEVVPNAEAAGAGAGADPAVKAFQAMVYVSVTGELELEEWRFKPLVPAPGLDD